MGGIDSDTFGFHNTRLVLSVKFSNASVIYSVLILFSEFFMLSLKFFYSSVVIQKDFVFRKVIAIPFSTESTGDETI